MIYTAVYEQLANNIQFSLINTLNNNIKQQYIFTLIDIEQTALIGKIIDHTIIHNFNFKDYRIILKCHIMVKKSKKLINS